MRIYIGFFFLLLSAHIINTVAGANILIIIINLISCIYLNNNHLGAKPQLSRQIVLNYVVGKFYAKIAAGPFAGYQFVHDFNANRQDLYMGKKKTDLYMLWSTFIHATRFERIFFFFLPVVHFINTFLYTFLTAIQYLKNSSAIYIYIYLKM